MAHSCATTQDMIVSSKPEGLSAYCFRCGLVGFRPHGKMTLQERTELLERTQEYERQLQKKGPLKLPDDFSLDIPVQYMSWLSKASITELQRRQYRIGWSHGLHRIVIPVCDRDGTLLYWQARSVLPSAPKYINPSVDKNGLVFWAGDHRQKDTLVVTEDILSAIRVSEALPAASLLGCKMSDAQALQLGRYSRVLIWLDPDEAGIKGALHARSKLGLLTDVEIVRSDKDPKNLSRREVARVLDVPYSSSYAVEAQ